MKFTIKEEVGVTACATDDSEVDEEEDDEVTVTHPSKISQS